MSRIGSIAVGSLVAALAACEPSLPPPIALAVGDHALHLRVPEGFRHYDHGVEHRFERELNQISLEDLGPVTPQAFHREIGQARELFLRGQRQDAQERLKSLDLRSVVPTQARWEAIEPTWETVRRAGVHSEISAEAVVSAYDQLLNQLTRLPARDLEAIAGGVLGALDSNGMRDVAELEALTVCGREALRIDTWDRLSHSWRRRHLLVLNEGSLLVARMELGEYSLLAPAFDALAASLELPEPQRSPS